MTTHLPLAPDVDWDLELLALDEEPCYYCDRPSDRVLCVAHHGSRPDCEPHPLHLCDHHADDLWRRARSRLSRGPGKCNECNALIWTPNEFIRYDRPLK